MQHRSGRTPGHRSDSADRSPGGVFKLHGSEQESISTRDHAFCVWAKIWCLGWTISHRSGDGFCDPYPATDRRILNRVEQGRTSPTSLDKVRLRLIDFHPFLLITNTQPKRFWTWYVFFFSATVRSVSQFVCVGDHSVDDYEEVKAVPQDSVLDVYRQAATLSYPGSQGPNVLSQLTA